MGDGTGPAHANVDCEGLTGAVRVSGGGWAEGAMADDGGGRAS